MMVEFKAPRGESSHSFISLGLQEFKGFAHTFQDLVLLSFNDDEPLGLVRDSQGDRDTSDE